MRFAHTLLLGALWLAPLALPAAADDAARPEIMETFDASGYGGFKSILKLGQDGAWTGEIRDGAFVLSNQGAPGAVRYFTVNGIEGADDEALRQATLAVDVDGKYAGDRAAAGLIFGLAPEQKTYLMFVVTGTGKYALLARDLKGVKALASGENAAIHAGGVNRLEVKPGIGDVALLINDQRMLSFKVQNGQLGQGAGIVAFGEGEFRFDNFALTEAKG
jgi:hypothetical protein